MKNAPEDSILISIIIATYNAERHIYNCLESILNLSGIKIEVVIVDGGSNDRTKELVMSFNSSQIKWSSEPDKGIYDAMNKGIAKATGKWLYFMGADDRLLGGFEELARMLKNDKTVYYGNSSPFFENIEVDRYDLLQGAFDGYRLAKYCMNHQSIFYPASAFELFKYELEYKVLADYAFNLRLWGNNNFKKVFYPITIVSYNMGGFSAENRVELFYQHKSRLIRQRLGWRIYIKIYLI